MRPRSDGFSAVRRDQAKVPAADWAMPYDGGPALPHDLLKPVPAGLQAFYPGGAKATLTKGAVCVLLAEESMGPVESVCRGLPAQAGVCQKWLSSGIRQPHGS